MRPISRRQFLALSATFLVASCSSDDTTTTSSPPTDPTSGPPASTTTTAVAETSTTAITTAASTSTVAPSTTTTAPAVQLSADPFALGVAAGDPDASSVVLWTRLAGDPAELGSEDIEVAWEVLPLDGDTVLSSGSAMAEAAHGHSVHVTIDAEGPFRYQFRLGQWTSPAGRAAPLDGSGEVRLATASCQHFETGFYAAHRDLTKWRPDLVAFLGDFIYEGASQPADPATGRFRSHDGPEPMDLAGYRARYSQYLSDPDLQAARAACPWLMIWDDHEVENNYAGQSPQDKAETAAFPSRRDMAYEVWWEHQPVRLPAPTPGTEEKIYRTVDIGDLARIVLLDGRQYRSDQVCDVNLDTGPPCPGWDDPARTMLGLEQERWLVGELSSSTAKWNVIAQQTVMTDLRLNGAILNYDQWDGYVPARDRLLASLAGVSNVVVVTGDIHLAGVGEIADPQGRKVPEFVCTSVSSSGNVPADLQPVVAGYETVVDAELVHRGYTRHTISAQRWTAEFRIVEDVGRADSPVSTWRTFEVDPATGELVTA